MPRPGRTLALSLALLAAPVAATTPEDEVRHKANGEFLFKHYPPKALAAGEQGRVSFRITLDEKGELTSCDVTKSSGYASLDSETCDLMQRYARFTPEVNSEGRSVTATRNGFVNWQLPPAALAAAKPRAITTAALKPDKIICRRGIRTGSLASSERRCMSQSDWAKMTREARGRLREVQGKGAAWDGMPTNGP